MGFGDEVINHDAYLLPVNHIKDRCALTSIFKETSEQIARIAHKNKQIDLVCLPVRLSLSNGCQYNDPHSLYCLGWSESKDTGWKAYCTIFAGVFDYKRCIPVYLTCGSLAIGLSFQ